MSEEWILFNIFTNNAVDGILCTTSKFQEDSNQIGMGRQHRRLGAGLLFRGTSTGWKNGLTRASNFSKANAESCICWRLSSRSNVCVSVCFVSSFMTFQALHLTSWHKIYILQVNGHLLMTIFYTTKQKSTTVRTQTGSSFFLKRY